MKKTTLSIFVSALLFALPAWASDIVGTGKVNAVMADQNKVNLSPDPIPAIGWPAMTMDLNVAPGVDMSDIKPGSDVEFMMEKGPDGIFRIKSMGTK